MLFIGLLFISLIYRSLGNCLAQSRLKRRLSQQKLGFLLENVRHLNSESRVALRNTPFVWVPDLAQPLKKPLGALPLLTNLPAFFIWALEVCSL